MVDSKVGKLVASMASLTAAMLVAMLAAGLVALKVDSKVVGLEYMSVVEWDRWRENRMAAATEVNSVGQMAGESDSWMVALTALKSEMTTADAMAVTKDVNSVDGMVAR